MTSMPVRGERDAPRQRRGPLATIVGPLACLLAAGNNRRATRAGTGSFVVGCFVVGPFVVGRFVMVRLIGECAGVVCD